LLPEIICLANWVFGQELWDEDDFYATIITPEELISGRHLPSSAAPQFLLGGKAFRFSQLLQDTFCGIFRVSPILEVRVVILVDDIE
jgi:hypothetical protein